MTKSEISFILIFLIPEPLTNKMAPKPKAVKKDKKDKDTKSEADVKRQKQANMITQLKASEEKKKKVDSGLVEVDDNQRKKNWMLVYLSWPNIVVVTKGNRNSRCWKPLKMTRPARVGTHPSPGQ